MTRTITDVPATGFYCSCGEPADYVCECGCLCCGEDQCAFGCGGSVVLLGDMQTDRPDLEVREP